MDLVELHLKNDSKCSTYEKVLKMHLETGPRENSYSFGFLMQLLNDVLLTFQSKHSEAVCLDAPINICGDIRGRYSDVLDIFKKCGWPFDSKYLFLGNIVTGGQYSLETLVILLCAKLCFPQNVFILRGYYENNFLINHDNFFGEFRIRYPNSNEWIMLTREFKKVFQKLPLCAIINNRILCVNSMIESYKDGSRNTATIKRYSGTTSTKMYATVKFNEPDEPMPVVYEQIENKRRIIASICTEFEISLIVTSNRVIKEGYKFAFDNKFLVFTSASKLSKTMHNAGVVMVMDKGNNVKFQKIFGADPKVSASETADIIR